MPIVRVSRRDTAPAPEPDAPIHVARHEATRRSAKLHPAAAFEHPDDALRHELVRLVAERLVDASGLTISVVECCVSLRGSVSSPLSRLLAEDLVFTLPEVRECRNELVVRTTNVVPRSLPTERRPWPRSSAADAPSARGAPSPELPRTPARGAPLSPRCVLRG